MFKLPIINRYATLTEFRRSLYDFRSCYEFFKTQFDFQESKAKDYIIKNNLSRITYDNIMKVFTYCEGCGYTKDEMLKNPDIFRMHPISLDQYYTVMTEGGFKKISILTLTKFRTICKRPVKTLKESHLIDPDTNVAESFIKHLTPCPNYFRVRMSDSHQWCDVHMKVMTEYLKWRLKVPEEQIIKLITTHVCICRKSFKYLCENIALAEELGFTNEKMIKYGYILHAYPPHSKELLRRYPEIAGVSLKKSMRMYPKLVNTSPLNVEKIYKTLKEHNIPEEAIAKRMNIFHLSPETVELRLRELEKNTDMKVLLHNPNILRLVVHHNRAKSRLTFLKQLQLKCATVSLLGNDDIKFDNHIKEGRDFNTFSDIYSFLRGILKRDPIEFEAILKRHPYYQQVPLTTMEETYRYLIKKQFTCPAILQVIYILLYPKEKIKKALMQVSNYATNSSKTLSEVNRLNLILYFIEREHHFTGDGIWTKSEVVEENTNPST